MAELLRAFGCTDMTSTLRRVLVRRPLASDVGSWRELGWRSEPDLARLSAEHESFCSLLEDAGAEVIVADGDPGNLDAIYTFDPVLVVGKGAILLQPGKPQRRNEPRALVPTLEEAGLPIVGGLTGEELAEGGDAILLDDRTLLVGRTYRTNGPGIDAIRRALPGVGVVVFDLPHFRGESEVFHLLSLLSPLAEDLVVAYLPLLPVRLVEFLRGRGVRIVEVPDEEFETMGPNALALAPRIALALARNRETRRLMEAAGVEVVTYEGAELSKGDGGPTCLTRPLLRG